MQRKVLQDFVNVFCQMFVGWRMSNDLSKLTELGDTQITINVFSGTAFIQEYKPVQLYIAEELSAWFLRRLTEVDIPLSGIVSASLSVDQKLRMEETKTKRVAHFDFDCKSEIRTNTKTYHGSLKEAHSWHESKRKR